MTTAVVKLGSAAGKKVFLRSVEPPPACAIPSPALQFAVRPQVLVPAGVLAGGASGWLGAIATEMADCRPLIVPASWRKALQEQGSDGAQQAEMAWLRRTIR